MITNQKGMALIKLIPVVVVAIVLVAIGLVVSTFIDNQDLETLNLEKTEGTTYIDGENQVIAITGNVGDLTCSTSNTEYANCRIEDNKLIIVPGTKAGEATITVFDNNGKSINYIVKNTNKVVSLSLNSLTGTATVKGNSIKVTIKGENYGKLTCSSSNEKIATCSISENTLIVTPKTTSGKATITVKEATENKTAQYILTVNKSTGTTNTTTTATTVTLALSNTSGTTTINGSSLTATISGKNYGKLTCSSSNTKVATCAISGTKLTITPVSEGSATITVKESKKSKTVKYSATIEGNVKISLSNTSVTTYVGSEVKETIKGENYGTLSCSSSNNSIATCVVDGTTLKVTAKAKGNATITVKEAKANKTVTYSVRVEEKSDLKVSLSLASTSGNTYTGGKNLTIAISGKDYGQLTCKTTNATVATCKIEGTNLVVIPGSTSGTASIIVQEANKNSYVTYKVTNKNITLSLASTSGVVYIGSSDITVAIKGSNYGTLSCESADDEIATCKVSGKNLIISPNKKVGTAIITVKENVQNKTVEYTINVNEPIEYGCANGILVEDSAKGGAICIIDASVKDAYVCTESEETTTSSFFCNDSYVESVSDSVIISCSTDKVTGPIEADGKTYNCNNQYLCHIIEIKDKCIDGYYKDSYYCPTGWKTYAGSNETLTCYKSATVK